MVSTPFIVNGVRQGIKDDFSKLCASKATTKIYSTQRIKTNSIYVPEPSRDKSVFADNGGYLDISKEPLNDSNYGFTYVEADTLDNKHIRISNNGAEPIDALESIIELRQTVSPHIVEKNYLIEKSVWTLRERSSGQVLAERTVFGFRSTHSAPLLISLFIIPHERYCKDAALEADLKYYRDPMAAWGKRALAFVRSAVTPISENTSQ